LVELVEMEGELVCMLPPVIEWDEDY
jgi:hypothetical protein